MRRTLYFFLLICVLITLFIRFLTLCNHRKEQEIHKVEIGLPYRTIFAPGNSGGLIGYTIQKVSGDMLPITINIKTKDIHPAKEDYKAYCRNIIADVLKTVATDRVEIHIFDNDTACDRYQTQLVTDAEGEFIAMHSVATYYGNLGYGEEDYLISFYDEAHNTFSFKEHYKP